MYAAIRWDDALRVANIRARVTGRRQRVQWLPVHGYWVAREVAA